MRFDHNDVPSVFAAPHLNALHFRNFFPQGVGGSLEIAVLPHDLASESPDSQDPSSEPQGFELDRWSIDPPQGTFRLAAGEERLYEVQLQLRSLVTRESGLELTVELKVLDTDAAGPALLSSVVTLRVGETVVAGTSRARPDDEPLLILLSALPLDSGR